ncbi:hypothetical protein E3H11_10440 [Bradyrhizobium brasilense]|uniref:DUF6998 domain-containing protein n=1 Tax=Bradyrhizobium brasilense TaxID=1419277 RepID=UPI00145767E8|nr:hypothetical protein [Bradyrhizobium brasilense]NLS69330.1 hypothetical protein [Bradyrhizobium brasilense]
MISKEQRIEAMKGILASLFASQRTLKSLAPQLKWAGLGNLLGDYGEFIAVEAYGLQQAPRGANGYDAITPDGRKVQVKANYAASQIGFRGEADLLLCLKIDLTGDWTEIYYGDFSLVKQAARHSARDNKSMVPVTVLTKLKEAGYKLPSNLSAPQPAEPDDAEPI